MTDKKQATEPAPAGAEVLLAVRQREKHLEEALEDVRRQAQALRQEADSKAAGLRETGRNEITAIQSQVEEELHALNLELEKQFTEELAAKAAKIASDARGNMAEAVQFLIQQVIPKQ